jgi:hypothetical protein
VEQRAFLAVLRVHADPLGEEPVRTEGCALHAAR